MNKAILSTKDGKQLDVEFNDSNYTYSIDSKTVDTSNLIEKISNTLEKIEIDRNVLDSYIESNPNIDTSFLELVKFIVEIFESMNYAIASYEEDNL